MINPRFVEILIGKDSLSGGVAFNEYRARSLILNASYEPVKIVNWQKAMILWFQEKVEVLEYHGDLVVRSAHDVFKLPSVMRLRRYVQPRIQDRIKFNRENVYARDLYLCQYCEDKFPAKLLTLDHVVPLSKGGTHTWENVVAACGPCNNKKGGRTPEQAHMPLRRPPFKPRQLPRKTLEESVRDIPHSWLIYLPAMT